MTYYEKRLSFHPIVSKQDRARALSQDMASNLWLTSAESEVKFAFVTQDTAFFLLLLYIFAAQNILY